MTRKHENAAGSVSRFGAVEAGLRRLLGWRSATFLGACDQPSMPVQRRMLVYHLFWYLQLGLDTQPTVRSEMKIRHHPPSVEQAHTPHHDRESLSTSINAPRGGSTGQSQLKNMVQGSKWVTTTIRDRPMNDIRNIMAMNSHIEEIRKVVISSITKVQQENSFEPLISTNISNNMLYAIIKRSADTMSKTTWK
ncbi:hypothetical protein BDQ17DRAFT_1327121 [Cyathus striatus]|nr:hypothetical protein BDQ17DRAFT_1327121 [Cyathus striatus]